MFVFGFIPNTQTELSGIEALGKLRFEKELGKVVDATSNVIKPALQAFKEVTALPLKLNANGMVWVALYATAEDEGPVQIDDHPVNNEAGFSPSVFTPPGFFPAFV